jgi:O-antigen ligase
MRLLLLIAALVLVCGTFFDSSPPAQWNTITERRHYVFLAAVAGLAAAGVAAGRSAFSRRTDRWMLACAVSLPAYAAFQAIPLPAALVGFLSTPRAEQIAALSPFPGSPGWAPLAVAQTLSLTHAFLFISYLVVFLAAWQYTAAAGDNLWGAALPILCAGAVQSVSGLSQAFDGPDAFARGSFGVRSHFAGFLDMAFPLAIGYPAAVLARAREQGGFPFAVTLRVAAGASLALLILAASLNSLSRMVLPACVAAIITMAVLASLRSLRSALTAALVALAAAVVLLVVAPPELVERYASQLSSGRVPVWHDTLPMIRAYRWFGCGLGGYESAFPPFQTWGAEFDMDYAHNDYLQFLAELGVAGFALGAAFGLTVLRRVLTAVRTSGSGRRWLACAVIGSLAAILVHAGADFNLYIPANAAALAWICGTAAGLRVSRKKRRRRASGSRGIAAGTPDISPAERTAASETS